MPAKKKIMTVLGARPQLIKSKPLSELFKREKRIKEIVVHTGQHYDFSMSSVFMKELCLPRPAHCLGINRCDNATQISAMFLGLRKVIKEERPNLVLVYGDTNSTLAGALAAKESDLPLAHIEAGLRSNDIAMAEELNRRVTDSIADLLFAPVKEAAGNLKKEGITEGVYFSGDVLYDLLLQSREAIGKVFAKARKSLMISEKKYIFLTLHRAETVDNQLSLRLVMKNLKGLGKVIFPVHPRTRKRMNEFKLHSFSGGIHCIAPQSYLTTLALINNASLILTDSGGVQREAYMLKVPCVTLRNETEWNQTLRLGWNRLVPVREEALCSLPGLVKDSSRPAEYEEIFGNGRASVKILSIIKRFVL